MRFCKNKQTRGKGIKKR
jgi:hypothetical protein